MGRTLLRPSFLNAQISCPQGTALTTRHRQCPDPTQHVAEQPAVQMPLGQQQPVIPRVLDQPAPIVRNWQEGFRDRQQD